MSQKRAAYESNRDCAVYSLMHTTGKTYDECHEALEKRGRRRNCGTHHHTLVGAGHDLGFAITKRYLRRPGKAKQYTMKTIAEGLRPSGKYIIFVYGHFAPFVDGQVKDWSAGRNHRVKFVYEVTPRVRVARKTESII